MVGIIAESNPRTPTEDGIIGTGENVVGGMGSLAPGEKGRTIPAVGIEADHAAHIPNV